MINLSDDLTLHRQVRIGVILLSQTQLTEQQLDFALDLQRRHGGVMGECLISLGYVTTQQVSDALMKQRQLTKLFCTSGE